jgi:acyl-coenzyme A synthetase/AMP-(fatty) acid ligase
VPDLPKTPAGKTHRKKLREQEAAMAEQASEQITQ